MKSFACDFFGLGSEDVGTVLLRQVAIRWSAMGSVYNSQVQLLELPFGGW